MFTLIVSGIFLVALFTTFMDHTMRHGLPRPDLFLAAAAATPAATEAAMSALPFATQGPRFFSVPLVAFPWGGVTVHLTAPDLLAVISSAVLVTRFMAWALPPLIAARKRDEDEKDGKE